MSISRAALAESVSILAPGLDMVLAKKHGERVGFVLMMIGAVKEWLARQEAGITTDPPGPKVEA